MTVDEKYNVIVSAEPGEVVWDDLTKANAKIVRKDADEFGNVGYWLDSEWLGGGRHPWEISPPRLGRRKANA